MSTLISDLEGAPPGSGGDNDFVASILNEINGGAGGGGGGGGGAMPPMGQGPPPPQVQQFSHQPPPAVGGYSQGTVISAPNPNTLVQHTMDNNPATAHMIGGAQPTPADFAQIMSGGGGGGGAVMAAPQDAAGVAGAAANYGPGPVAARGYMPPPTKKSWLARSMEEFRTAFFVAILVFVFSLPVVNFLFAHYLPRLVKSTGELTVVGLLAKSFAAGATFWILHRVVVPLLSF